MGIAWHDFRRLPLAVWRGYVDGFVKTQNVAMRRLAWQVSLQLIAAGCDADEVTPAKLLGDKEPRKRRQLSNEEKFEKMWARAEKKRAAGKLKE